MSIQRKIGVLLFVALLLSIPSLAATGDDDGPETVVRRVFDAFNRHDVDGMAALYAADAEILTPDQPQALRGPRGIRAEHGPLFTEYPDIHDRLLRVVVQGGDVAVEFVSTGCAAGRGACFSLPIVSVLTVRGGHVVRDATYFNVPPVAPSR